MTTIFILLLISIDYELLDRVVVWDLVFRLNTSQVMGPQNDSYGMIMICVLESYPLV